jgi:FkbM family methyltransferase
LEASILRPMAMPTPQFFATLHCLLPVNGGARENWPRAGLEAFAACGPEGRVVACEPNPLLAGTYLPQNLALNGFYHGVEICPKVIGNLDDRTVDFVLHDGDFATSSLERWAYAHRCGTVQAPAITLDQLCTDWPRLDLVKIDAEGAEALVWEGMQKTLRRFPHAAVVLELHLQRDPPQVEPPAPARTCRLRAPLHQLRG